MHRKQLKSTVTEVCKRSAFLQKLLFKIMDAVTVRTWHVKRELRNWLKTAPKNAHILDAGAGVGQFSYWLSCTQPSLSVLAVDASHEQVCAGNRLVRELQRTNLHFQSGNISDLQKQDAFELVMCIQVLEYVKNDETTIHEFFKALREGGKVLLTTKTRYADELCKADQELGIERCGYVMKELKAMFKKAGFKKVKAHYTGGKFGKLAEQIGFVIPVKMLGLSKWFFIILPFYFAIALPLSVIFNWIDSHTAHDSGEGIVLTACKLA